LQNLAVFCDTI